MNISNKSKDITIEKKSVAQKKIKKSVLVWFCLTLLINLKVFLNFFLTKFENFMEKVSKNFLTALPTQGTHTLS